MNFAANVIVGPAMWGNWEGYTLARASFPQTFADTSAMAQEAIRKAQWRKIVSRLPAGVQDRVPPEGA